MTAVSIAIGLCRLIRPNTLIVCSLVIPFVAGCSPPTAPSVLIEPISIESVDVLVMESFPPQAAAHVTGVIGDGCSELHSVQQQRTGTTVVMTILRERPRDAICTQIAKLYDETIPLEGTFPPGPYDLIVNGFRKAFVTQ